MCIVESVFFIKNGNSLVAPCTAVPEDRIETDAIVSFSLDDVGKIAKVGAIIRYPDGIERQRWSPDFVVLYSGYFDFIVPVDLAIAGAGNYSIIAAECWDKATGTLMCQGSNSGGFCQSLAVGAPAPAQVRLNFYVVPPNAGSLNIAVGGTTIAQDIMGSYSGLFDLNKNITLRAMSLAGYKFEKWVVNTPQGQRYDYTSNPITLTVTQAYEVNALFLAEQPPPPEQVRLNFYVVPPNAGTLNISVAGTTVAQDIMGSYSGLFDLNKNITLRAMSLSGYRFEKWVVNTPQGQRYDYTSNPITLTVTQAYEVNALFLTEQPLKYKCSGAPDYACTQAADGTYDTLAACQAACKAPPPPQFTLSADKTAITSGDRVTFSGKYKPNTEIGLFYEGALTFLTKTTTDGAGNFVISLVLSSAVQKTVKICACVPSVIPGACAIGEIRSNCVSVTITPPAPLQFTLSADKTAITSGDRVTFSGKYKPGVEIGLYYEGAVTFLAKTTTDGAGNFTASLVLSSTVAKTASICACVPSVIPGACAIGEIKSNCVSIAITPIAPVLRYKCSGAPNYACTQSTDGTYATLAECQAACKPSTAMKYKCSGAPDYACTQAVDGTYDTLAACQAACKAVAGTGTLIFVTNPPGAEIFFGEQLKGRTNETTGVLTLLNVPAGTIKYTVKKAGYNDSTGAVTLAAGESKTIPTTLTSGVSATTAIVVALLGAGIIGAVIMTRRKK